MNAADIIERIMGEVGLSQKKLANKMGLKAQQGVFNMLNAKRGVRTDTFVKAMDAMGYDVLVRNRVNDTEIIMGVQPCDTDTAE